MPEWDRTLTASRMVLRPTLSAPASSASAGIRWPTRQVPSLTFDRRISIAEATSERRSIAGSDRLAVMAIHTHGEAKLQRLRESAIAAEKPNGPAGRPVTCLVQKQPDAHER